MPLIGEIDGRTPLCETILVYNTPLSVSRYDSSLENDSLSITASTLSVRIAAPVAASHSLTVRSHDADVRCLLSDEKATAVTPCLWPWSTCNTSPIATSHSLIVLSFDTDASCSPSGEKATALTVPV
jgi:hypothetical protein